MIFFKKKENQVIFSAFVATVLALVFFGIKNFFSVPVFIHVLSGVFYLVAVGRLFAESLKPQSTRDGVVDWPALAGGVGMTIVFAGGLGSFPIFWYRLSPLIISFIIFLIPVIALGALLIKKFKKQATEPELANIIPSGEEWTIFNFVRPSLILSVTSALVLAFFCFKIRFFYQLAPPPLLYEKYFGWTIFVLAFLAWFGLFLLIFSRAKVRYIFLVLLLVGSVFRFSLSFLSEVPWGSDHWRIIGVENLLLSGQAKEPVLFDSPVVPIPTKEFLGLTVPEALVSLHKYSYAGLWSATVFLSALFGFEEATFMQIYLVPILSSLLLPFLLFRLGALFFRTWRAGLVLAGTSLIPFSLQAALGLTLPVSYFIFPFLLAACLWFFYLQEKKSEHLYLFCFLFIFVIFGYPLYGLFGFFLFLTYGLFSLIRDLSKPIKLIVIGVASGLFAVFFTVLDVISGFSYVDGAGFWPRLSNLLRSLSGWRLWRGLLPHDVIEGNVLFNNPPATMVPGIADNLGIFYLLFSLAFFGLAIFGFFLIIKISKRRVIDNFFLLLLLSVGGGMKIGWIFLSGERLFTRRLDPLFSVAIIFFFVSGLGFLFAKIFSKQEQNKKTILVLLVCIFLSATGMLAMLSGPDILAVPKNKVQLAQYIHEKIKISESGCVLSDNEVLLPLEAVSKGKVVGGGFPIDEKFSQPEKFVLLSEMYANPRDSVFKKMLEYANTNSCLIALDYELISKEKISLISQITRIPAEMSHGYLLWYYEPPPFIKE